MGERMIRFISLTGHKNKRKKKTLMRKTTCASSDNEKKKKKKREIPECQRQNTTKKTGLRRIKIHARAKGVPEKTGSKTAKVE